ncbi:GAF domain-containing protein [Alteromonas facilis]|uniref:GAF domain-containing protein n=1 Tax=Alteromonas facilis TaxID=2048004 RepID=UPI000C28E56D|nr:GAF domain-containing protein [Alteromonas facilis]
MKSPLLYVEDTKRLAALYRTQLLDSEPEERFDAITRMAKQYFDVAISTITLVDKDRQWFKSKDGLDDDETDLSVSFCAHAIAEDDYLYVPDARQDERFAETGNVVAGPLIRFYAGAVIRSSCGQPLGTLCVIDPNPRALTQQDFNMLLEFAHMVNTEIKVSEQQGV